MSPSSHVPSTAGAVLSSVVRALQLAGRCGRGWLLVTAGLYLALGLLPAVQVVLVQRVVDGLATPASSSWWWPLSALAAAVGCHFSLAQTALAATQRLALRMRLAHQLTVLHTAAAAGPVALAEAERIAELQAAHEASRVVDTLPGDVIRLCGTLVAATGLCWAIATINLWSGLLIVLALLPTLAAFTRITRAEQVGWPRYGAAERRAQYATEQLLQQRSATELATLGSSHQVVAIAGRHRQESLRIMDAMIAVAMRWEMLAGLVTAGILAAALAVLVLDRPSPAGAAAALTGTIAGLGAMRSAGYAAGGILSALSKSALLHQRRPPPPARQQIVPVARRLEARNLTVRYSGSPDDALHDVSIHADQGEMIALVGVNGAGKTTLVNVLLGTIPATGEVSVDGRDLAALEPAERLSHFGLLTQEFGRYEFTARETVALATPDQVTDAAIESALSAAEAGDIVAALPAGLDSQLGQQWGGTGLSGGQWQRLALTRIHLRGAGIWILDEPTSAIDAEAEEAIFEQLHQTRHRRITLVVSHRAWTLRAMDRIYVLDRGRMVQTGTYAELSSTPGRFATLFATQTAGSRADALVEAEGGRQTATET